MFIDEDSGNSDPWGSLSPSGNSDPSWDSDITGGDNTGTDTGTDTGTGSGSYTGGGSEENVFDPTSVYEITNTASSPGSPGYGWKYYSDGTSISPDGKYYHQGEMVYDVNNPEGGTLSKLLGKDAAKALKGLFVNADGTVNLAGLATMGAGLYNLTKNKDTGGYNKPVPKMDLTRQQVPYAQDPNRAPGAMGRQYFTDQRFTPQGDAEALAAAQTASGTQAAGILAAAPKYAAPAPNPYAGKIPVDFSKQQTPVTPVAAAGLPAIPTREQIDMRNQQGATVKMAQGGIADAGRYLQGKTDGMADKIETSIDGEQPALLSHGEFVIPADVVSHLGNGNSEAGADKLYNMMDKIRQARTGTKAQGKEIDADKFIDAASGGLMAAYAGGGEVQGYNGTTGSAVVAPTPTAATAGAGIPQDTSRTSTLSPWVGDYVTNALGQGAALANAPYQAYQGPLTAGASDLQQQAFAGASDIASAGYTPGSFMGGFGSTQANQYMNPYIQASLDPQLTELKRASDIARLDDAARLTKAGAFGGSRQAIMESEGRRNLLDKQQALIGQGYKTAYDTGLGQFNKEREAEEASRRFSADFGLKSVGQLADMGATQRGITSEGLAADRAQFQEERDFAYKMPQYQLGLLSGLPIGASTASVNPDSLAKLQSDVGGLASLYKTLAGLGVTK